MIKDDSQTAELLERPEPQGTVRQDSRMNVLSLVHILSNWVSEAFYEPVEKRFGLTVAEWRVIFTLIYFPGTTAKDIMARWAMNKMAVSRAIRSLEAAGRIRRAPNPLDRRSYSLELTPRGQRLYEQIIPSARGRYLEIVSCLDDAELAAFRRTLEKLIASTAALAD